MNILSAFEAHKRDEDFDRHDAARHRETCNPAGGCYTRFVQGEQPTRHFCLNHEPTKPLKAILLAPYRDECPAGCVNGAVEVNGPGGTTEEIDCPDCAAPNRAALEDFDRRNP